MIPDVNKPTDPPSTDTSATAASNRVGVIWLAMIFLLSLMVLPLQLWLKYGPQPPPPPPPPPPPRYFPEDTVDPLPKIGVSMREDGQRFGFVMLEANDPLNPAEKKKLTGKPDGETNNTRLMVDGGDYLYGHKPGKYIKDPRTKQWLNGARPVIEGRKWVSAMEYPCKVRVWQSILVIGNSDTMKLDTAIVHYKVENNDSQEHKVGLRIMLDTYIGAEDGTPFSVPGLPDLLTTKKDFNDPKEIPHFVQALERPDLSDPGTIATLTLKLPNSLQLNPGDPPLDPIVRMLICRWPGDSDARYDFTKPPGPIDFFDMNDKNRGQKNDSCVALFWEEKVMPPNTKRCMAFTYGLGALQPEIGGTGSIALSYSPKPHPGEETTITAWLKGVPKEGQRVSLNLPVGWEYVEPDGAEQVAKKGSTVLSSVSWKVKVRADEKPGPHPVSGTAVGGGKANLKVIVLRKGNSIF